MPTPTKYSYSVANDFNSAVVAIDALTAEIQSSSIVTALDYIKVVGGVCDIWFKDALSAGDKTTLDNDTTGPSGGLIGAHTGTPLVETQEVIVQEQITKTPGGHYQSQSIGYDVPASVGWHEYTFDFPIDICLLSAEAYVKTEHDGDEVELQVSPETTIGALIADSAVNDTVFDVQQSVIDNIQHGYCVKIDDGTNNEDLGRCTVIDTANNKITVETQAANAYLAATPTYIKMTVQMVRLLELVAGHRIVLGESKIGGTFVTKGTSFKLRYNNKDGAANKRFSFFMEYLY